MWEKLKKDVTSISSKVWAMLLISFIITLTKFMILPFLAIYFSKVLNFSPTTIGILLGTPPLAAVVFSFFSGVLADKTGIKKTLSIGLTVTSLGYVGFSLAESFWVLFGISIIIGVSWNLQNITLDSYISKITSKDNLNKVFGYKYWGTNLGGMIGPIFGVYIGSGQSDVSLYIVGAVLLIIAVSILFMKEDAITLKEEKLSKKKIKFTTVFSLLIKDKALIYLTIATICAFLIEAQITANINLYIADSFEDGITLFAQLLFVSSLSVILLQPVITHLTDKTPDKLVFIIGSVIFLTGPMIFLIADVRWLLFVAILAFSIGEMVLAPREESLLAKIADHEMRTTYFSVARAGSNVGFTLGPLVGGFFLERFNGEGLFFMIIAIMMTYSIFLLLTDKHANQLQGNYSEQLLNQEG